MANAATSDSASQSEEKRDQPKITLVELLVFALIWFIFFRLIAIPLLVLAVWCSRPGRSRFAHYASRSILVLSLFAPFDLRIAEMSAAHRGTPRDRFSIVPYVNGVPPAHTRLIAEYGEYDSGPAAFPPRWVISISLKRQSHQQEQTEMQRRSRFEWFGSRAGTRTVDLRLPIQTDGSRATRRAVVPSAP